MDTNFWSISIPLFVYVYAADQLLSHLNNFLNDEFVFRTKLKAFADRHNKHDWKFQFGLGMVENIVGKGFTNIFSFSLKVFKGLFLKVVWNRDWMEMC